VKKSISYYNHRLIWYNLF